jgi:uncharacterized membrane protein
MNSSICSKINLSLALVCGLGLIPAIVNAQAPQNLPKLEGLYHIVSDINNNGLIVGGAIDLNSRLSPAGVEWNNGTVSTLPTPNGFKSSYATAVNDNGVIVGVATDTSDQLEPIAWENGLPVLLETKGFGGFAYDINNAGDIVGYVNTDKFTVPALWRNGELIILSGLYDNGGTATAIDDQGRIVGSSSGANDGAGVQSPTQWVNNLPTALPVTFGENYMGVLGINRTGGGRSSGYVVEKKFINNDPTDFYFVTVAVGWQDGAFRELQNPLGNGGSVAYGVNASGLYAGYITAPENGPRVPTIWDKDGPIALPLEAEREAIAVAANDNGLVVGIDTTDRRDPTPVLWNLNTTATIQLANIQATPGQSLPLQAKASKNGVAFTNPTVKFQVDGKALTPVKSDAFGVARLTYKVPFSARGKQVVTASLVTGNPVSRNIVLGKSTTVAAITPARAIRNKPVTLKANLRANDTNVALANRKLNFLINGKRVGSATTSNRGIASISYKIPANSPLTTLPIEVRYAGDTKNRGTIGRASITVIR